VYLQLILIYLYIFISHSFLVASSDGISTSSYAEVLENLKHINLLILNFRFK
jgi:hypothetical protein